ncbi:SH3 and cysteine-rich domain-containing protein [Denticeps clupeoides]|uniref:SH3 and cysteine-rich domain-containing protein n=1 Tax=Denticeps clupeoides TaxID=299321 RepID=UPI0010A49910|nr:SH3 and cysteine-rich domain-containing protein [Denticeps clupeoides]
MIPPANMMKDENIGKENEEETHDLPQSPSSRNNQESKLQRLKRSLSFKTKSLRSKSADNFFQRPCCDIKFPAQLISDVSCSTGQLSACGVPPALTALPPHPGPAPPATACPVPAPVCSPTRGPHPQDPAAHSFVEHIFKKPIFCDLCNHMIVGTTAKHGLRCKACKMSIHHKCVDAIGLQKCMGKLPKGFRRYQSSPLLMQEQYGCIKEVMPIACGSKVDPVYEALRFGTSLAQKTKRASGSESPHRKSSVDLAEVPEEVMAHSSSRGELTRKHSDNVFTPLENGTEHFHTADRKLDDSPVRRQLRRDLMQLNAYVALYSFTPQDSHDLEMRPGDRILLEDDSDDDWWKGVIEDRIGFFPASFAQQLRAGDQVFRCNRTFIGCKEQGQITVKEGQICVSGEEEHSGFIRVASGKKTGFVPYDVLENI